jgi:hypothetical protein
MHTPSPSDSPWTQVLAELRAATAGEFFIQRELGRGGFAAVFLAHELALGRKVAIKVMSPAVMMGEGMIDRFLQEARTVASLNHPNIITIHAVRRLEELPYFVMKFVRGRSLEHVLRREGRLPVPVIRDILFQVGSGLAYAHRRGVIHRDIKPANILLDDEGNAIVTDFGIAKVAESPGFTATGMVVGTLTYMSPEQCESGPIDWTSDQYSLGIVAYEMLTGAVPFTGSSFAVMHAHAETPPPPIRSRRPDCPPELESAVDRMLAKEPEERWPTMADALAALGAVAVPSADPLREELARLALADLSDEDDDGPSTVPSPVPYARAPLVHAGASGFSLAVSAPPDSMPVGARVRLKAVVRDATSREVERKVEWRSTDPGIASVSPDGVVTAVGNGEAAISARAEGVEQSVRLVVSAPEPAATAVAAAATRPQRQWWWVVAAVAIAAVAAIVLRRPKDEPPAPSPTAVDAPGAANIELSTTTSTVSVGDSAMLVATLKNEQGFPILGKKVTWSTSDNAVASVDSTGRIVAKSPGTAEVTAASDRSSAKATITVTATPEPTTTQPPAAVAAAPPSPPTAAAKPLPAPPAPSANAQPVAPKDTGRTGASTAATPTPVPAPPSPPTATPAPEPPAAAVEPDGPPTGRIEHLALGGSVTCGTLSGGRVVCWGGTQPGPVMVGGVGLTRITAGEAHLCGLTASGGAYCWGNNSQGQLGDGSTSDKAAPVRVKSAQRFASLSAGGSHTCGITTAGAGYCWGANSAGQVGDGSETTRPEPSLVRGDLDFKSIAAGGFHTCALTKAGEVYCWGEGSSGQLGSKGHEKSAEPVSLETSAPFKAITAGNRHTCALTNAGKAFCWGENAKGQLGDASTDDRSWPQPVVLVEPFRTIDAGSAHTCGILASGALFCWGDNSNGQLGDGTRTTHVRPTRVSGDYQFVLMEAGTRHTCATPEDGSLLCWGSSSRGQAGGTPGSNQTAPTEVYAP